MKINIANKTDLKQIFQHNTRQFSELSDALLDAAELANDVQKNIERINRVICNTKSMIETSIQQRQEVMEAIKTVFDDTTHLQQEFDKDHKKLSDCVEEKVVAMERLKLGQDNEQVKEISHAQDLISLWKSLAIMSADLKLVQNHLERQAPYYELISQHDKDINFLKQKIAESEAILSEERQNATKALALLQEYSSQLDMAIDRITKTHQQLVVIEQRNIFDLAKSYFSRKRRSSIVEITKKVYATIKHISIEEKLAEIMQIQTS